MTAPNGQIVRIRNGERFLIAVMDEMESKRHGLKLRLVMSAESWETIRRDWMCVGYAPPCWNMFNGAPVRIIDGPMGDWLGDRILVEPQDP